MACAADTDDLAAAIVSVEIAMAHRGFTQSFSAAFLPPMAAPTRRRPSSGWPLLKKLITTGGGAPTELPDVTVRLALYAMILFMSSGRLASGDWH